MLDKNDRKYIIRRIITYIAIAMIMLLFNTIKTKALVFNVDVQKNRDVTMSGGNMNFNLGIISTNSTYNQTSVLFTQDITCNTNMCGLEFYYTATCSNSSTQQTTGSTSLDIQAVNGELAMNYGYPNCTVNGNTISCLVNNNSRTIGATLYFGRMVDITSGLANTASCKGFIKDTYAIYDIPESVSTAIQQNTQAINNVNNSINDDSGVSNNDVSGGASDWASNNANSGVINQLVLMPVTLLQSFTNGINGSCSTYDFGELWGEHITLPCINLSNTLGAVWTIIDVIMSGIFIFIFGKRCVKIFNDFTNLKSGQIDSLYGGGN